MPEPNTGGNLRTSIAEMEVGDYIKCHANTSDAPPTLYGFGEDKSFAEMPVTGANSGNYFFYFVLVEKHEVGGLLIADRVIRHSISWDVLNSSEYIEGKNYQWPTEFAVPDKTGILRSLGGGNSYADANGNSSKTDAGLGAWPTDNEWDTYIVKKDYGTGAGRDDVWHWNGVGSWVQETPINGIAGNSSNAGSRWSKGWTVHHSGGSNGSAEYRSNLGFRPCFEYEEVTP